MNMISKRQAIKVVYSLLFTVYGAVYITDLTIYENAWQCSICRQDDEPTVAPLLTYFSTWSIWSAIAVFIAWLFLDNTDKNNSQSPSPAFAIARGLFAISFPLVIAVTISYIFYTATTPVEQVTNLDACYTLVRSAIPRNVGSTNANVYLAFAVISDLTAHYMGTLLLLILLLTGELPYTSIHRPWSTAVSIGLGIIIGVVQNNVATIYCTDSSIWILVGAFCLVNFVCHVLIAVLAKKLQPRNIESGEEVVDERKTEETRDDHLFQSGETLALGEIDNDAGEEAPEMTV